MDLREQVDRLRRLHRVGIALSAEHNRERLVERILLEAKELCRADGGTIYLRTEDDALRFAILRNDSLGLALGGTTGREIPFPPIPMKDAKTGAPNHQNVASYCALVAEPVNISDAYDVEGFDFSGAKRFDAENGYRSKSFLTIPMTNHEGRVIGVLQLLNARDQSDEVVEFTASLQEVVEALASQAAVALDNQMLIQDQRRLMESFIKLIAAAIDDKSPYTGGHCRRVPVLTEMLAKTLCELQEGPFADFDLTEVEWYELRIAAWLHDCGKVTSPVHVMDKATKLETIFDRIEVIRARYETLARDARIAYLEAAAGDDADVDALRAECDAETKRLEEELAFLEQTNMGGEFLSEEKKLLIRRIGGRSYTRSDGTEAPVLTADEVENLCISRGTLTDDERIIINGHMVQTIRMLEALPFPQTLRRVPEYAGGHHEKMDGTGYPKGLFAGDMSIPARIMAIADVFEALTAQDRPYKKGKTLTESMRIMGFMKRDNHLDPELFDVFVKSGVYRLYAERFLPTDQIDEVNEQHLLEIEPSEYELPERPVRDERWRDFLPRYRKLIESISLEADD